MMDPFELSCLHTAKNAIPDHSDRTVSTKSSIGSISMVSKQEALDMFNKSASVRQVFDFDMEDESHNGEQFDALDWADNAAPDKLKTPPIRKKALAADSRGEQVSEISPQSSPTDLMKRPSSKSNRNSLRLKASDLDKYLDEGETDPKKIHEAVRRWKVDNASVPGSIVSQRSKTSLSSTGDNQRRLHRSKSRSRLTVTALQHGDSSSFTNRRGRSKSRSKSTSDSSSAGSESPSSRLQHHRRGRSITQKPTTLDSSLSSPSSSVMQRPEAKTFVLNRRRSRSQRRSITQSTSLDEHVEEVMERRRDKSNCRSSSMARHLLKTQSSQDTVNDIVKPSGDAGSHPSSRRILRASSDPGEQIQDRHEPSNLRSQSKVRMVARSRSSARSKHSHKEGDGIAKPHNVREKETMADPFEMGEWPFA